MFSYFSVLVMDGFNGDVYFDNCYTIKIIDIATYSKDNNSNNKNNNSDNNGRNWQRKRKT